MKSLEPIVDFVSSPRKGDAVLGITLVEATLSACAARKLLRTFKNLQAFFYCPAPLSPETLVFAPRASSCHSRNR